MLSKKEDDQLIVIYDSLIQLYVLRDQAGRAKDLKLQGILKQDIEAVEMRWRALREKRRREFN